MEQLVGSCAHSKKHAAMTAALFHLEFESIHPFVNANGRTGRLMSNFLLMRSGYEPVNIQAESRARYIAAIRAFQEADDPYPFAAFFWLNLVERLQKVLDLLTGSASDTAEWRASNLEGYLSGDDSAPSIPKYHRDTLDDTLESAILSILREEPSASQSDIADHTGKSIATVKRAMKRLSDAGAIRRVGGKRYGRWTIGE